MWAYGLMEKSASHESKDVGSNPTRLISQITSAKIKGSNPFWSKCHNCFFLTP